MPKSPAPATLALNDDAETHVEIASLVASRTREGAVGLHISTGPADARLVTQVQMDLPKAREIVGMLQGAIEAALSDALLFTFLTKNIGLNDSQAAGALLDFREMRQGSRGTVRPS